MRIKFWEINSKFYIWLQKYYYHFQNNYQFAIQCNRHLTMENNSHLYERIEDPQPRGMGNWRYENKTIQAFTHCIFWKNIRLTDRLLYLKHFYNYSINQFSNMPAKTVLRNQACWMASPSDNCRNNWWRPNQRNVGIAATKAEANGCDPCS